MARQLVELEPAEAVAATVTAMRDAARYAGGGIRTSGRRMRRRMMGAATEGAHRVAGAYGVLRGGEPELRRRPVEFVAVAAAAGTAGAITAVAVRRVANRRTASAGGEGEADTESDRRMALTSLGHAVARTVRALRGAPSGIVSRPEDQRDDARKPRVPAPASQMPVKPGETEGPSPAEPVRQAEK
jgi:hypothetical protein